MARTPYKPKLNYRPISSKPIANPIANPTADPPRVYSRAHTDFTEVRVHTAKCDSCEKHSRLTLYRCMECGQHVCSSCWKKSGDRTHVFGGGSRNAPKLATNNVIEKGSADTKKGHENASPTRTRRRVHVISDDDDDDFSALKTSSTTKNPEPIDASKQQSRRTNLVMESDQHQDHPDDLPNLWPMVPPRGLPVSRPAAPTDNTSPTDSVNPAMQLPHILGEADDPEHQQTAPLRRQSIHATVGEQERYLPVIRPSQGSFLTQQATVYARLLQGDVIYRSPPGSDTDGQTTNAHNQPGFVNPQFLNFQAPRSAQPSVTFQQPLHQIQPALYPTRPGADTTPQAGRFEWTFVPYQQNSGNRRPPRPAPAPVLHQHAVPAATGPSQPSVPITQHQDQTTANTDQVAARDQSRVIYTRQLKQHAEAHANAKAMGAHNRQALDTQSNPQPAVNRDQLAARNQQAFISNQGSSSTVRYEQILAARDAQQTYLSRPRENRPASSLGQTRASQQGVTDNVPPPQAFLPQIHAASPASRQVQEYPPEDIEAAGALLLYSGAEQSPRDLFRSEQKGTRDSHMLSPASQPKKQSSAPSGSRPSSATLVSPSAVAGAHAIISPRALASYPSLRNAGAESVKDRLEKHRKRLTGLQSPLGTPNMISDTPASQPNHPSNHHTALQPGPGATFADSSATKPDRSVQSHPQPGAPMSEHAAAYLNQWDAGRAALSTNTAVTFPTPMRESHRSAIPAMTVQGSTASGKEQAEVEKASAKAPNTPVSMPRRSNSVDVVMNSPEAETPETDNFRNSKDRPTKDTSGTIVKNRDVENHPSSEPNDEIEIKQEPKAAHDRKQSLNQDQPKRNHDDGDNDSDVELIHWKKTTAENQSQREGGTKAKDPKLDRVIKRGVAYVKKPEGKARKGKKTGPKYVG